MKAWVLHGIGDLRYETLEKPEIKDDEVLIAVKAVGICGSDIPRVYQTGTYSFPLIPGHEFSGLVEEAGANIDKRWIGKSVGVFPLIPCKKCAPCKNHKFEICRHYSYLGSRKNGGLAEYAAVPADNLIELPEKVTYEQAAIMEPMAVAVHAIRNMQPDRNHTIAVCGLGTIGTLVIMFLKEMGVKKVFAIGNKDFQRKQVYGIGIEEEDYCDSRSADPVQWIRDHTNGMGVDMFFECVGRNETIVQAIECSAAGGNIQLIGNPVSDISYNKDTYWKILRNQLTIKGSWNSSFTHSINDDWHYVLDQLKESKISPEKFITQRLLLADLDTGLQIMKNKTEEYCKVMINI